MSRKQDTPVSESPSLFDAVAGRQARDAGAAQVLIGAETWRDRAIAVIEQIAREQPELTADDLRERLTELPPHHNAFGAVFLTAARRNIIAATDRTKRSTREAAHAHRNPIWQSCVFGRTTATT